MTIPHVSDLVVIRQGRVDATASLLVDAIQEACLKGERVVRFVPNEEQWTYKEDMREAFEAQGYRFNYGSNQAGSENFFTIAGW